MLSLPFGRAYWERERLPVGLGRRTCVLRQVREVQPPELEDDSRHAVEKPDVLPRDPWRADE
eukprot:11792584-Heterocapsa_arctica.AAC.1